ncbi:MAG: hypothetical protein JWP37_2054 [Mucilaginibacter sp.]|nr:hypothetical protein [Mucilaginibacter sp.]
MKSRLFTLLILTTIAFVSCRKTGSEPDIKAYDQQQILSYISSQHITGMLRDTSGGDTTGIYYKIITPGTGKTLDYTDSVAFVYTIHSLDGKYVATDTVLNHYDDFLGHVSPNGLMLGIRNILKKKGGQIRMIIPSRLAYGTAGAGSGSKTVTNGRIAGNESLDYYVNLISDQHVYDNLVIKNYIAANSLSGYTETASGVWYKIKTPGTGTSPITDNTTITAYYTLQLMNNTVVQDFSTSSNSFNIVDLTPGVSEALKLTTNGGSISMLIPSGLAYGPAAQTGIPANACLRFEFTILTVTP